MYMICPTSLEEYLGDEVTFTIPEGSYHIWAKIKRPIQDKDLFEAALQHGVAIVLWAVYRAEIRATDIC
jgi:GntR family transcriptional regulator, regulator for abcA and norABC